MPPVKTLVVDTLRGCNWFTPLLVDTFCGQVNVAFLGYKLDEPLWLSQYHNSTPDNFYTRHFLHQAPFTPLSPNTVLQQTSLTPHNFYTRGLLHQTPFTPETFTPETFHT